MAEKCACEAAKDRIEDAYRNPSPYYGVLQDIMDAEIDYARMCDICTCRKRHVEREQEPTKKRKLDEALDVEEERAAQHAEEPEPAPAVDAEEAARDQDQKEENQDDHEHEADVSVLTTEFDPDEEPDEDEPRDVEEEKEEQGEKEAEEQMQEELTREHHERIIEKEDLEEDRVARKYNQMDQDESDEVAQMTSAAGASPPPCTCGTPLAIIKQIFEDWASYNARQKQVLAPLREAYKAARGNCMTHRYESFSWKCFF